LSINQKDNPLVSICIPAYNVEKYIKETITNILNQSYSNTEIIIVDDGSTDNTLNIIKSFDDKRIKVFSQQNKGAASARNLAYNYSSGSLIKFMDADDLLSANFIFDQVVALNNNNNNIASASWGRFTKNDLSDFKLSPEEVWKNMSGIEWLIESLYSSGVNMTPPSLFLIPRFLIEKYGLWRENLNLIDDFEFMTRMIANCDNIIYCENSILHYRSGIQSSLSNQKSRKHYESAQLSIMIGIEHILSKDNSKKAKLACANSLQVWIYEFYPKHKDLSKLLIEKCNELGGSNINYKGGRLFEIFRFILGWKLAKRLQLLFWNLRH